MFWKDVPRPISPSPLIGREVATEKRNLDPLAGRLVIFYVLQVLSRFHKCTRENPTKMDNDWGYPYFRKPSYSWGILTFWGGLSLRTWHEGRTNFCGQLTAANIWHPACDTCLQVQILYRLQKKTVNTLVRKRSSYCTSPTIEQNRWKCKWWIYQPPTI